MNELHLQQVNVLGMASQVHSSYSFLFIQNDYLEVLSQIYRVDPNLAVVDNAASDLEQQQFIKGLQTQAEPEESR